jgi:hypothetical protein
MNKSLSSLAAFAAIVFVAGCSGGGISSPIAAKPSPTTSALPTQHTATGSITLTVAASSARGKAVVRKRAYVSGATQGVFATFVAQTAGTTTTQGYTLAPGVTATTASPASCTAPSAAPALKRRHASGTGSSYTCTLYFTLVPGDTYTTTLTSYDNAQTGTTLAAGGNALSTDTESVPVLANMANTFAFRLQALVAAFDVAPQYVGVLNGSETTLTSTFTALDADDFVIDALDDSTNFAYTNVSTAGSPVFETDATPNPAFTGFPVVALDEGFCDSLATTTPCTSSSAPPVASPASEAASFAYSGVGDAGVPASGETNEAAPYYAVIALGEPAGYGGFTSATIANTNYAAATYLVPFNVVFSTNTNTTDGSGNPEYVLTGPTQSVSGYTSQFHPPTGAASPAVTGTNQTISTTCGSGGTAADSSAGPIATITQQLWDYGVEFSISPTTYYGTCTVTFTDVPGSPGSAGSDTRTITITSSAPQQTPTARRR